MQVSLYEPKYAVICCSVHFYKFQSLGTVVTTGSELELCVVKLLDVFVSTSNLPDIISLNEFLLRQLNFEILFTCNINLLN